MTDPAVSENLQSASTRKKWLIGLTIVALALTGFCSWVAYPNFMIHQSLARQVEAKTNLALIFEAERAFHDKHYRYGNFDEIGFPSANNSYRRYTYRIDRFGAPGTIIHPTIGIGTPDNTIVPAGLSQDGQGFTATATANLDNDDTVDQWHVNDLSKNEGLNTPDADDVFERVRPFRTNTQELP